MRGHYRGRRSPVNVRAVKIHVADLRAHVLGILAPRFGADAADRIAEVLLWAELSGVPTQGVLKLSGSEPLQDITPRSDLRIVHETALSIRIDAGANPAPLAVQQATDAVIAKASTSGFAIAGVHNLFSSTGAQGFYATRIAEAGLIGVVASRALGSTAGFGSIDPLFGTNPIAFSFPTQDAPLVFDITTSAMTFYGLVLADAKGESLAEGMAIDRDGRPTRDAQAAMDGALLPFGGHKGAGLALVVEVLAGVLPGASFVNVDPAGDWGATVIAIDPQLLLDRDEFRRRCSELIERLRSARTGPQESIRLPGDRAKACYDEAVRTGAIDIDDAVLQKLGWNTSR